jgi:hypothetical protein
MTFPKAKHVIPVPCEIPQLQSDNLYLESAGRKISQGLSSTPNTAGGVTAEKLARGYQVERLTLTAAEIEIDEANDYGSLKLVDLPASNIIVAGVVVNLVCTVDGTVITDPEDIDYAVGTAALASTDFSNAGEKNLVGENDVAALGVMQAAVSDTEDSLFLAAGAKAVYLNIQATIGTTATQSFAGTVDLIYLDLGSES